MAYVSLDSDQIKKAHKKHKYTKEQVEQLEKCMDEKTGPLFFMKTFMKIQHPTKGEMPFKPYDYQNLKLGKDLITEDGKIIQNESLTLDPDKVKTYAFCSDTSYNESIVPLIEFVDLLYHEATFLDSHANLAKKTKHSTAKQAAKIAKLSKVKRLILGHFSTRYKDKSQFITEAKSVFDKVELASDGKIIHL